MPKATQLQHEVEKALPANLYEFPVSQLLSYGNCLELNLIDEWPNYLALGFTESDIPELIRMATDWDLYEKEDPNSVASWAPVHAWRTLGQLKAEEAIVPLLDLFKLTKDEWVPEELPVVYSLIGPACIPALQGFLTSQEIGWQRIFAVRALEKVAESHPSQRSACIAAINEALQDFQNNEWDFNGMLIASLLHLKATDAAPLIQKAYEADTVDERICGSWEDVAIEMGVLELSPEQLAEREKLKSKQNLLIRQLLKEEAVSDFIEENTALNRAVQAKKAKQKRKAAKLARQLNRKRK